jgi:glycosyltransferase involved in cell wall biosynthesis
VSEVTVVIPFHGDATLLDRTLASVAASGDAPDVVVVADGSDVDEDALRAHVPGLRVLRPGRVGRSRARNLGVEAARTPVVAFLDADDVTLPGRWSRQVEALRGTPAAALAFGRIEAIGPDGRVLEAASAFERERFDALLARGPDYVGLLADCPIYTSATAVDRDRFLAAGGYDGRIDAYEDLDLYLRLARAHGLVDVPGEPVAQHRRHGANTASAALYEGSLLLVDKHLPTAAGRARALLLERRVDALWGLGRFAEARRAAWAAARTTPAVLRLRRFDKRLAASLLPQPLLRSLRR